MDAVDDVVLGAGAVVEALVRRGESVRVVNRSPNEASGPSLWPPATHLAL
jgi:LmbE family N-acetylglucosaminyl deacetylase